MLKNYVRIIWTPIEGVWHRMRMDFWSFPRIPTPTGVFYPRSYGRSYSERIVASVTATLRMIFNLALFVFIASVLLFFIFLLLL